MNIKAVLNQSMTQAMADSYSSNVCRHIIWAFVCDGRFFFSKMKLCCDLQNGKWLDPPNSLLDLCMDKIIYVSINDRPNYLHEWLQEACQ